ncbi:hypothetical protein Pan44_28580 [Caulifigura coniformis]|uniref:Uncharacterized protein n=1 Tax=Caulifigura coniformis TaxID=2527983 RepID=A0A517SFF1_9PLAN|nr:hypothetical protein Pan44_28580 [Caulifigura coniformis]
METPVVKGFSALLTLPGSGRSIGFGVVIQWMRYPVLSVAPPHPFLFRDALNPVSGPIAECLTPTRPVLLLRRRPLARPDVRIPP